MKSGSSNETKGVLVAALLFSFVSLFAQKVVRYDLYVADTIVNYAGKEKHAIAVNGRIPMPTLEFTEGDVAEIAVHNRLKENTSLHWHGVWLPNEMDGVPYLTQMPIAPGATYTYRFPIKQNGTHWYHSHSGYQEQIGMYGMFVMHKKGDDPTFRKGVDDLPAVPVILSEWTNLNPKNIQRMLHYGSDWFAIKKGATQSYWEALKEGHFGTKVNNEWKRMLAMDVSDIHYDAYLINGEKENHLSQFRAGDKVRLRIANGGGSDYFWLTYSGGKITVVANDGNDVEPVEVDRLLIAVSETYDIVVTIPEDNMAYELLATPEDRSGSASLFLGSGMKYPADRLPALKYFEGMKMMNDMMKMNGDMKDMGMNMRLQQMDMNAVMYPEMSGNNKNEMKGMDMKNSSKDDDMKEMDMDDHSQHGNHSTNNNGIVTLNYGMLKSPAKTNFTDDRPVREIHLELTGNMNRYVWSMNNKVLSETDKIPVEKDERLRLVLYNNSMMRHPMHLHGFDFRVFNDKGDYAPMKNVIDIMPMETDTIEFVANKEGDWFFHCHILYHMMSGMNRVFEVGDYQNPNLPNKKQAYNKLQKGSNMLFFNAENDFASNGSDGKMSLENTRWSFGTEWRLGYNEKRGYESETHIGRYIGKMQWFMPFIGFDTRYRKNGANRHERNLFGQKNKKDKRAVVSLGFSYTLPMLVNFQTEAYHEGKVRLQLSREDIPLTPRMRGEFMVNTDYEYMGGLRYILTKNAGIRVHYDSDMGFGAGIKLTY